MTVSTIDLDRKLRERTSKPKPAVRPSRDVEAENRRRATPKPAPKPKAKKGPRYSEAEKATVKRAEALRGGNVSLGPLQVARVRKALDGRRGPSAFSVRREGRS